MLFFINISYENFFIKFYYFFIIKFIYEINLSFFYKIAYFIFLEKYKNHLNVINYFVKIK